MRKKTINTDTSPMMRNKIVFLVGKNVLLSKIHTTLLKDFIILVLDIFISFLSWNNISFQKAQKKHVVQYNFIQKSQNKI